MRIFLLLLLSFFVPSAAYADCINPAGVEGKQIYNTTYKTMQFCDGTNWIAMRGGVAGDNLGNHTATTDLNMDNNKISNVTDPTAAQDAVTKAYVDGLTGANETDPKIGTLTEGKWCTVSGGVVVCTSDAPSGGTPVLGQNNCTLGPTNGSNCPVGKYVAGVRIVVFSGNTYVSYTCCSP